MDTTAAKPALSRSLNLTLAVLFGLGVTVGAGIYVLIGATASRAGIHAPLAFLVAAIVMAPTAASFAELATRWPVSAGEAAFVREGFGSDRLALIVGFMVAAVGVISAAAIARGSSGYIRDFVDLPTPIVTVGVVLLMGGIAARGILESVTVASIMTLIEIGGLLVIVIAGAIAVPDIGSRAPELWSGLSDTGVLTAMLSTSLLAFFAFIGFEGLANIAEEVIEPQRNLPRAIFLTLAISTLLYMSVVWVTVISVPHDELGTAQAPLSLVFRRLTGASPSAISAIAIVATANGIIVQMVMASRVIYGLADRGMLPAALARIHPTTSSPIVAAALVVGLVLCLAVVFPLESLAELTSILTLLIFASVNAALVNIKYRGISGPAGGFVVPIIVPIAGVLLCLGLGAAAIWG
ncbi:MAG: APC family permease [Hyphomicrobiaceae bacterium]